MASPRGHYTSRRHDDGTDFVLVLDGALKIELHDRTVHLAAGELFVVPQGVQHRPVAEQECHVLLIERTGTPNSGDPATAAPRRVI